MKIVEEIFMDEENSLRRLKQQCFCGVAEAKAGV